MPERMPAGRRHHRYCAAYLPRDGHPARAVAAEVGGCRFGDSFRKISQKRRTMIQITAKFALIATVLTLAVLAGMPGVARADGLIANWTLNAPTGTTSIPDASGNGHTATLLGSDTLTSMSDKGYPSAPVGGGLYFSGLAGTGNCLSVPYSPSLGGMTCLTLSSWVYYPPRDRLHQRGSRSAQQGPGAFQSVGTRTAATNPTSGATTWTSPVVGRGSPALAA